MAQVRRRRRICERRSTSHQVALLYDKHLYAVEDSTSINVKEVVRDRKLVVRETDAWLIREVVGEGERIDIPQLIQRVVAGRHGNVQNAGIRKAERLCISTKRNVSGEKST
jgi:hypothetical protein